MSSSRKMQGKAPGSYSFQRPPAPPMATSGDPLYDHFKVQPQGKVYSGLSTDNASPEHFMAPEEFDSEPETPVTVSPLPPSYEPHKSALISAGKHMCEYINQTNLEGETSVCTKLVDEWIDGGIPTESRSDEADDLRKASTKDVRFSPSTRLSSDMDPPPPTKPALPAGGKPEIVQRSERPGRSEKSRLPGVRFSGAFVIPPDVEVGSEYEDLPTPTPSPQASLVVKKPLSRRVSGAVTDDLSQMELLDSENILSTLKSRYELGHIQTYISDILISFNPYQETGMYTPEYHAKYTNVTARHDNEPHIFWVADRAFQCLRDTQTDQVILVSGESGAGKTESTKNMIKHFTHISKSDMGSMHEKIVMVNPLLEAFGNAQTLFNRNSSRFGKLIELSFTASGHLVTGQIIDYLLEKSRVVDQPSTDRNFHMFYYLFAGMGADKRKSYYLENANEHKILTCGGKRVFSDDRHMKHCKKMFKDIENIFTKLGFDEDDVTTIYTSLAAVLHITNIEFIDASTIDETTEGAVIGDDYHLRIVGDLLQVDVDILSQAFVSTTTNVNGEIVVALKTVEQACDVRDALAKMLYVRLFGWLVRQVNINLQPADPSDAYHARKIGILDFAGFENFDTENGFEQFCINIANEQLQNYFNQTIFAREQEQYSQEGVDWTRITFPDNTHLLNMFLDRPTGMLELLDEESRFPKATHLTLISKCRQYFGETGAYQTIPGQDSCFCIRHYADVVLYNATEFLPKNRDTFSSNLKECMLSSENEFINDLFAAEPGPDGQISRTHSTIRNRSTRRGPRKNVTRSNSKRSPRDELIRLNNRKRAGTGSEYLGGSIRNKTTMSQYFKTSLKEMMKKLQSANAFFVRCIKPNDNQIPDKFNSNLVERQLKYNGVLELAKIRKVGYPVRMVFRDFTDRYRLAVPHSGPRQGSLEMCQAIMTEHCRPEDYVLGRTKVFLKDHVPDILRIICEARAALMLQMLIRCRLAYEKLEKLKREKKAREEKEAKERERKRKEQELKDMKEKKEMKEKETTQTPSQTSQPAPSKTPLTPLLMPNYDNHGITNRGVANHVKGGAKQTPQQPTKVEPEEESSTEEEASYSDEPEEEDEIYTGLREDWDVAQLVPREARTPSESFDGLLRLLKVLLYIFIFLVVLICTMTSQASVLILTSNLVKGRESRNSSLYQLLAIMLIPQIFIFVSSFITSLFGRTPWPSFGLGLGTLIIETLHVVGLNILLYRVMPRFSAVYALSIMYAVCSIPGFLKLIFATSTGGIPKKGFIFLADSVAFLVQLGAVAATIMIPFLKLGSYRYGIRMQPYMVPEWPELYWQIPMGLVLTSIKWWENYVDTDRACLKLFQAKKNIQLTRTKTSLITSFWNIAVTILFVYLLEWLEGRRLEVGGFIRGTSMNVSMFDNITNITTYSLEEGVNVQATVLSLTPAITQIVLGIIGYYFMALATQLLMQRFSYWLPLIVSAPFLAILITLQCENYLPLIPATEGLLIEPLCDEWTEGVRSWYMPVCIAWWMSAVWITIHTFFPRIERLARHEKIFVTPFYVGPLFVQSFLLNRRRNQREVASSNALGNYEFTEIMSDTSSSSGNNKETYSTQQEMININLRKLAGRKAVPQIYACATMWHESITEMKQLLKSLLRVDADQSARKLAVEKLKITDPDYYEFEAHVFFDDAFEFDDDDRVVPNQFVRDLVANINEAASAVMEVSWELRAPTKIVTPYGGRLVWTLPGQNLLIVHLKDKDKIRHKKRWSQVMYMYYLLGYRLFGTEADFVRAELMGKVKKTGGIAQKARKGANASWAEAISKKSEHFGKSTIFNLMEQALLHQAENTFLLALDGDVDFKPEAVRLLLDQMRKNPKTGAACGRIHPIGQGPMVWYQQFEYAIGHWFQKATEHVLGCVLCSPGCFSLFRGSAILDDNIMKRYTAISEEPVHFLQYDQGEDRWLCTLLLQQGYRVDYTAASDALTYAPETFDEFFNQRRRWVPSTMANIADLLSDYKNTVIANDNISYLYMAYQFSLMFSTILGPSTIVLAIANALWGVLQVDLWVAYLLSLVPVVFYLAICFTVKQKTQLLVGALLSVIYACIMVVVLVGIIQSLVTDGILNPSLTFLVIVAICFIAAAILHPYEFNDLPSGLLYYLCIPAGYLILMIYSLCNMHVVSWGTREVAKKKSKAQLAQEAIDAAKKKPEKPKKSSFFGWSRENLLHDVKEIIAQVFSGKDNRAQEEQLKFLKKIHEDLKQLNSLQSGHRILTSSSSDEEIVKKDSTATAESPMDDTLTKKKKKAPKEEVKVVPAEDPYRPKWISQGANYGWGPIEFLETDEEQFWVGFIRKYLKPLKKIPEKEAKVNAALLNMRNNASFGFWFINILWIIFNFMVQRDDRLTVELFGQNMQPQGLIFLVFFMVLLFLQVICMFIHRWYTFLQVISIIDLRKATKRWLKKTKSEQLSTADAIEFSREIQKPMSRYIREPLPDYDIEEKKNEDGTGQVFGANGMRRRKTLLNQTQKEVVHQRLKNHIQSFKIWQDGTQPGILPPALPPRHGDVEAGPSVRPGALKRHDGPAHALSRALRKTVKYAEDTGDARSTIKPKYRGTRHHKKSSKHKALEATTSHGAEAYPVDDAFEKYFDARIDRFLEN